MTSKGTAAFGKRQTKTHILCRRCGKRTRHKRTGECASCGYGKSKKLRKFNWQNKKPVGRKRPHSRKKPKAKTKKTKAKKTKAK